ncbi:hypothetical protein NQZ68_025667 [Dissostichus eleginoides]|nr:hypothetical protein NQZ68_025667 [Dissostichus eleginoides]
MFMAQTAERRLSPQSETFSLGTAGNTDVISLHPGNLNSNVTTAMARLEQVITNIVDVFLEYADDDGKKPQLNIEELKKVLELEIQSPELKDKINADDIGEAMEMLDKNHDGEVNFREFCRCVCVLARCYYQKKTGKGGKKVKGKEPEAEQED